MKYSEIVRDLIEGATLETTLKKHNVEEHAKYGTSTNTNTKRKKILRVYAVESAMEEYYQKNSEPITTAKQITEYITDRTLFFNFDIIAIVMEITAQGWKPAKNNEVQPQR
ncbi:hypothetical protein [Methanosarcina siciliae]|uniref:hypothetical protein n=1 Tax=Methanosarcina siciliae TaxID=38027 RepID=UPI0012E02A82|nr:hypothetical protein [Methanosarcina siciliae]